MAAVLLRCIDYRYCSKLNGAAAHISADERSHLLYDGIQFAHKMSAMLIMDL